MLANRKPLYQPPDRQAHTEKLLESKGPAVAPARSRSAHAAGALTTSAFSVTAALADISGARGLCTADYSALIATVAGWAIESCICHHSN